MTEFNKQAIRGYELREQIGEGGFGAVYRAHQTLLNRDVALKVILPKYANNPDFIRRFEVEAELVARLEHPYIVPLFDYWREPDGAYLAMRYLRGGNLRELLIEGALSLELTAKLLDQITEALYVAHRNGVVHRDIKPANILLDEDENAYLTDFGIAKSPDYKSDSGEGISGSIPYISPEQLEGGDITPQTDIYALGVMLYEMVTGEHPFAGATITEMIFKHIQESLPDVTLANASLPSDVDDLIQKATAKSISERFVDVRELARAFRAAIAGENILVSSISEPLAEDVFIELPNPYKGLRAFQEADADQFYGRDSLVERLLNRLGQTESEARFLAVVGPSGSGKSSVVKAGLIPAFRAGRLSGSENWFVVEMFPGTHPFEELEAALLRIAVNPPDSLLNQLQDGNRGVIRAIKRILPDDESELLIVIDQFEELFTLVEDETVREKFLENLISIVGDERSRVRIVVTLRADFFDRPLQYLDFGELLRKRAEIILPMSESELSLAISEPAQQVGAQLQTGLVQAIISDVGEQPGTLPLLQYALTELFERRTGRTLELDTYHEIGGVTGALARRAEEIFLSLDESTQDASRQLFLRLVTLGEGTEDTRRRVRQAELPNHPQIPIVLDHYGKARLLTFDRDPITRGPTIEVAHEALIRTWERLKYWVANDREGLRIHRRLTHSAQEWQHSGQDSSFLATGGRLAQFEAWIEQTNLSLNQSERAYLTASIHDREERNRVEEARKEHEARISRRVQNFQRASLFLAVVALIAIISTIIAGFVGLNASSRVAIAQETLAPIPSTLTAVSNEVMQQQINADAIRMASRAEQIYSNGDMTLGLTLAVAAFQLSDVPLPEVQTTLFNLASLPGPQRIFDAENTIVTSTFNADATILYALDYYGNLTHWDITTGEIVNQYELDITSTESSQFSVGYRFSTDGSLLATFEYSAVSIWSSETGEKIHEFSVEVYPSLIGPATYVPALRFGHNNQEIAFYYCAEERPDTEGVYNCVDSRIIVWDVGTGDVVHQVNADLFRDAKLLAFSASGDYILYSIDRYIYVLNLVDRLISHNEHVLEGAVNPPLAGAFSPNGRFIVTAGSFEVILWDLETGTLMRRLEDDGDIFDIVQVSSDNQQVIVSGESTIFVWDLDDDVPITLRADSEWINALDFDSDTQLLVSGHQDGQLITWNVTDTRLRYTYEFHIGTSRAVSFRPTRWQLLYGYSDFSIVWWYIDSATPIDILYDNDEYITDVEFSPNEQYIASSSFSGTILVWDGMTAELLYQLEGHLRDAWTVEFSPDDRYLVSGSDDQTAILWDLDTGTIVRRFEAHQGRVFDAAFNPDGQQVLTASTDTLLFLWDINTGDIIQTFEGHSDGVTSADFSPDGRQIASGSWDNSAIIWDVETGSIIHQLQEHSESVFDVEFTPDGQYLLTASEDGTILLWSVSDGELLRRFEGHKDGVYSIDISGDGNYFVSTSDDGTLVIWRLQNTDELLEWVQQNRVIRPLTCQEIRTYQVPMLCETTGEQ